MNKAVIFDLDDTLYKEIDYLQSGFKYLSKSISKQVDEISECIYDKLLFYYNSGEDAFQNIIREYHLIYSIRELVILYRNHMPRIKLSKETTNTLSYLIKNNCQLGLLTDGRSIQQRNKISALDLERYIKEILISDEFGSEKPDKKNYQYFCDIKYSNYDSFFYIGDNINKDFIAPNNLGWVTICIEDNGQNIHEQRFDVGKKYLPHYKVENIGQILPIINGT